MTTCNVLELGAVGGNVDAEAGVVRDVKVCGIASVNSGRTIGCSFDEFGAAANKPYRYSESALRRGAALYEGAPVFVDHVEFDYRPSGERVPSQRERKSGEKFGWLRNVRATATGLIADLHFLRSHEFAPRFIEAAERNPQTFCLSHNAAARPALVNGQIVIEEIVEVHSVDIVGSRPGTVSSLFESQAKAPRPSATAKQASEREYHRIIGIVRQLNEAGRLVTCESVSAMLDVNPAHRKILCESLMPAEQPEQPIRVTRRAPKAQPVEMDAQRWRDTLFGAP